MTIGSMFHQTCYPTQLEAMQAACSSVAAFGSDGSRTTCNSVVMTGPAPSSTSGGNFPGKLLVTTARPDGTSTQIAPTVPVQACERYDYAYFEPLVGAFVAALVAIVAARMIYARVFNRETL